MKRLLLIIGALALLLGAALLVFRAVGRRGGEPGPDGTPTTGPAGELPGPGERSTETPAAATPLSITCPDRWTGLPDSDSDGLPDQVEAIYHTNEANRDTDGDGFTDAQEVRAGYHPLQVQGNPRLDSDNDGLLDHEECTWRTDPFTPDTDGDGFRDGDEVKSEFDPTIKGDGKGSDALPSRRASQTQQAAEALRPDPNSPNYTEGLAGLLTRGKPPSELRQTQVTAQQVQQILSQAPLNTALPNVPLTELKVGSTNTAADVRSYLQKVDALRPRDFGDPTAITNALTGAIAGNAAALSALRDRLTAYEQSLKNTSVPPSAVEYHRTLIALTRFVNDRFAEVKATAASDPVKAYLALRGLQAGLTNNLPTLQSARQRLESLAGS